jgi:hypothetical protein
MSVVLALVTTVFAGLFGRLDTLVLGLGVGLVAFAGGLKLPSCLLMSSLAVFLAAYLPFGVTSHAQIQGFNEGFSGGEDFEEDFEDDDGDGFVGKEDEDGDGFATKEDEDGDGFATKEDDEDGGGDGFATKEDEDGDGFAGDDGDDFEDGDGFQSGGGDEDFEDKEEFEEETFDAEGFANPTGEKKKKKRRPAPDHGSRAEMFELGKKYKMPKETDDAEFHLDAGTTFVNAYKQLKPDQISAMTKDTQELINTQKQLMTTLNTLKPLMTDGKQIMDTFQNYFGANGMSNLGDMSKMAEKFAPTK